MASNALPQSPSERRVRLLLPTREGLRGLLRLAWPLILANGFMTVQIVLDRLLLSRDASEEVAAGLSGAMLFWTLLAFFQNTANYATTFVAQYTGADEPRRAGLVVGQSLWFSLVSGVLFLGLVPLADLLVGLGGHAPELQQLEIVYFRLLTFAALPTLLTASANSFFAGRGDSRTVLLVNGTGILVNGVFASLLIYGYLGMPRMGIAGAGVATIIGSATSAILSLVLLLRKRYRLSHGTGDCWRFDAALFRRFMRFALPNGIFAALDVLAFTTFLLLVGRLGRSDLTATSLAFTLNLIAFLPIMGIGQAVEVLVGQRLGEDRPDEAERSTWTGLWLALGATFVVAFFYLVFPGWLVWPFHGSNEDPARWAPVADLVPLLLRFVTLYCLFDAANVILSFALRGAGDTRFVTAVSLGLAWPVMVLPTWLVLRDVQSADDTSNRSTLLWCWTFASVYIILLAGTFLARFLHGKWRSLRVIETRVVATPKEAELERFRAASDGVTPAFPEVASFPEGPSGG
jgi:multidrug resistance protein, MATE family